MAGKVVEGLVATGEATDAKLFNANPGRTFLSISNTHATGKIFVRFGTTAATAAIGLPITAGVTKTWGDNVKTPVPGSEVHVIGDGAGVTLYAYEHNGNLIA